MAYAFSEICIVLGIYFLAALAKGITGLGFSTACLPMLVLIFGLKPTLPLLIIPSIASNLIVMKQAGEFRITVQQFWPLYIVQIPGLFLGLWLLILLAPFIGAAILGMVLIIYCLFSFSNPEFLLSNRLKKLLALPTGFVTGVINGLTGSQVMPVLPYMLSLGLRPSRFIQAINCSFTLSSVLMVFGLVKLELMTIEAVSLSILGLLPVYFGAKRGGKLRERVAPAGFRKLVLILLILMGCVLAGQFLANH